MESLRILWFNWKCWLNPEMGGAELYMYEIAKRLVKMGHSVTLFTRNFKGSKQQEIVDGIEIVRDGCKYTVYEKAHEYYKSRFRGQIDLVIDGINTIPFMSPLYIKEDKIALIYQLTGGIYSKYLISPFANIMEKLESFLIRKVYAEQSVLTLSESVKEELLSIGFSNELVKVAEPGINHDGLEQGKKTREPTVLYLNRISPYKNPDHLIMAFRVIKKHVPNARLQIVGCRGGKYESKLRKLVYELGLNDSIEFYPFVSGYEKIRFLQQAWVHVLPSVKEGWGISALEAAGCGTPTVGYYVCGLKSSVRQNITGLLVRYGDINSLASEILKVLSDEKLRSRLSLGAYEYSKNFTWENTVNKIMDFYKSFA